MLVFRKFRALAAGMLVAAVLLFAASADASAASLKDGDKFGDWIANCPQGQVCSLMLIEQVTGKDGKPAGIIKAVVFRVSEKETALFTFLPLGYAIAPGVTIAVDGGKSFKMEAQRCLPQACEVALKLDGAFLTQMKKGKQAKVEFRKGDKVGTIALSLKGFGEGFSKM